MLKNIKNNFLNFQYLNVFHINININDSYKLNKDNIDDDFGEEENEQQGSNDSDYSGE